MSGDPYTIKLKQDTIPYAITAPRRIPLALIEAVKNELARMEANNIITKVTTGTEWCAPIVVVGKKDGSIRLCVDYTELNKFVVRERLVLPSTEDSLAKIKNAKVFTKLDARMSFWQVPLAEDSKLTTTFVTPFGRFCFNRLPFGITSAPEHFQRRLFQILDGIDGVVNLMDDVLIFGPSKEEHDKTLRLVLERFQKFNVTLNKQKCSFRTDQTTFLGHVISADGISPDPKKINAVMNLPQPQNPSEVRRLLGMYNYLTCFVKNAADLAKPIRDLLQSKNEFSWSSVHSNALEKMKLAMSSAPVLRQFDPNAIVGVSADSSSFALGAVLEQREEGAFRPVMYISQGLNDAEKGYAQIEKEALALTWACERLSLYLIGKPFHIQTDHKPLVSLFGSKPLADLTPRLQRLRLRMMRFDYSITHVPGKSFHVPDALSRTSNVAWEDDDLDLAEVIRSNDNLLYNSLPVSDVLHNLIREHYNKDTTLPNVISKLQNWTHNDSSDPEIRSFYKYRTLLSAHKGILLYGSRIVIPRLLRELVLDKIHSSHLGISKCRNLAKDTVWWPGISQDIDRKVRDCFICAQHQRTMSEPLIPTEFPSLPWSMIGADFLKAKGENYLIIQDYFSRFLLIHRVSSNNATTTIKVLKQVFSYHGVRHRFRSDNGAPFNSYEFKKFADHYGFEIVTSSPTYPQSNGLAESAVKTAKHLILKCNSWEEGLLLYNATALQNGYSPSKLLMGRKLRTTVPVVVDRLVPSLPNQEELAQKERQHRTGMKEKFDRRHGATHEFPALENGQDVWIKNMRCRGKVKEKANQPRSYLVVTETGAIVQRNRNQITALRAPSSRLATSSALR
ncbi:Hypothetical protein NTJ_00154 [Nesidiocoris tenuis]|uniref:RNA-directed DNA polymerase n=1 Tax=Nesidiocoris tenuis TaxID=355587 RepID=A0ABN7A629_9HEMI|nr:Hypothetical protein NTJ_00154 [Nesidiocoris tenuis]